MKLKKNPKPKKLVLGNIIEIAYMYDDCTIHRIDGPAIIMYRKDTKEVLEELYYINNKLIKDEFTYWVMIGSMS